MKRLLLLSLIAVGASSAIAQNLYSNQSGNVNVAQLNAVATAGNGTSAPTGGFWSECQTDGSGFANTSAGFTVSQIAPGFRLADDFAVTGAGWNVTGVRIYAYQTGSAGNPFNGGTLNIWSGAPNAGGSIVATGTYGGATDSIQINPSGTMGNIFRVFNTTVAPTAGGTPTAPGTTRRVWEVNFTVNTQLTAGNYWIDYQVTTVNAAAAAFAPSTTHQGVRGVTGANAMQWNGTTWVTPINDTGQPVGGPAFAQEMPFIISGTVVPEPATMAALGLGVLALARRRKKAN